MACTVKVKRPIKTLAMAFFYRFTFSFLFGWNKVLTIIIWFWYKKMPLLTTSLYQLVSKLQDVFEIAQQAASNRCRTRKEITIPYSVIRRGTLLFFPIRLHIFAYFSNSILVYDWKGDFSFWIKTKILPKHIHTSISAKTKPKRENPRKNPSKGKSIRGKIHYRENLEESP